MAIVGEQLLTPETGWKRIDCSDPNILMNGSSWSPYPHSTTPDYGDGTCATTSGYGDKALFRFSGTKIRFIGIAWSNASTAVNITIDGVSMGDISQKKYTYMRQTIDFEVLNLSDTVHTMVITQKDNTGTGYLYFDAVDIADTGSITSYFSTKTSTSQMQIGDRISCEYTATSNAFGTFANMGKATKPEIPIASTATPDGTFYLYHAGYNFQGKMILAPDRNIQHSISWDTLNTAGVASGSGLPIKIADKDCIVKLMTGGISATDKDNEWDKIIAESTLGGTITAGDNDVWNWSVWSLTSTRHTTASACVTRGRTTVADFDLEYTNSPKTYVGFRPILLVDSNNSHYLFLKDDYTCHSWDGTSLNQVSADWRLETVANKKALFLAGTQAVPSVSILQPLLKFKVRVYSDDTAMSKPAGSISAVPHKFFVKPKNLISLASFEGVDNVSLTSTISGTGACKILVTTDLVNYKTWNGTVWDTVDTSDLSAIVSSGLSPTSLSAVLRSAWDSLTGGKGGIAFGYLPTIESIEDNAAVDNLTFIVDMKGSWDKAVHGIDYAYGYPQNNILRVTLKTNGDYKINYSEGCVSQ